MSTTKTNMKLAAKFLFYSGLLGYLISFVATGQFSFFRGDFGIPILVSIFSLIFTFLGIIAGTILSLLIRFAAEDHDLIIGIRYGGVIGFVLFMLFWFTACLARGAPVCLAQ